MAGLPRYWDTGPFLAWLKQEAYRIDEVEPVIRAAQDGKVLLVTSSVTLVEVVKLDQKNAPVAVPPEDAETIRKFFERSSINIRTFDRNTAALARQLIWDHGLETRDAMHLATAVRWKMPLIETYDRKDLISLDGKVGTPPIEIRTPKYDVPPEESDDQLSGLQTDLGFDEEPSA